jgi:glucose/mannose-6-phosphate isomerase
MLALIRWGIVPDREGALQNAAEMLEDSRAAFALSMPAGDNLAKQGAAALKGRVICIYGTTGLTDVVALRYKCQFAENSKAVAFANSLPELNHNEIVGMDASADPQRFGALLLQSGDESPVARKRLSWLKERLQKRGLAVVAISSSGGDRLERLLSLVQFGDYLSYYLAIANGQDPTPIPAIEALKQDLR